MGQIKNIKLHIVTDIKIFINTMDTVLTILVVSGVVVLLGVLISIYIMKKQEARAFQYATRTFRSISQQFRERRRQCSHLFQEQSPIHDSSPMVPSVLTTVDGPPQYTS